ncbi:MAG: AsmA family protein [Desulfobacterales bacterium]|nr:AsmA family protein [Desulfobacterales bacterium]
MNIIKKILIVIIAFVVLIGIAGFLILPSVLKPVLTKKISEALHREASVDQIKINPYSLSATIQGFKLADPGQKTPFVAFDELYVNVNVMTSIFRRALILEEIRLNKPYIGVTRKTDGSYNFSDLIPKTETKKEEPAKPFLFHSTIFRSSKGILIFATCPIKPIIRYGSSTSRFLLFPISITT